jgi:CheY-like chemotaxis protein
VTISDSNPEPDSSAAKREIQIPYRVGRARRILLVDDNTDAATSCSLLLKRSGHEVEIAYDGAAALDIAARFEPEIAILDIGMPVMDGFELATRLRALPRSAGLALIALSGYDSEEDRRRGREAGFDHHVRKPVELPTLLGLIESLP